jgi:hypothetical protein
MHLLRAILRKKQVNQASSQPIPGLPSMRSPHCPEVMVFPHLVRKDHFAFAPTLAKCCGQGLSAATPRIAITALDAAE